MSADWSNINEIIRVGDNVEVVFNDEHRISTIYKAVEDIKKLLGITKMKTGSRLVENIECF